MEFRILGPLEVWDGKRALPLGGRKQRTVLAHLALRANHVVSAERLIDELWGEDPPAAAKSSLQSYVSHLRTALGSDRLEGRSGGYILHTTPEEVDAVRFDALVAKARRVATTESAAAIQAYEEALALWRGEALEDLGDQPSLRPEIARLAELRMAATEERTAGQLVLGRHAELVPELEQLTGRYPLRERLGAITLWPCTARAGRRRPWRPISGPGTSCPRSSGSNHLRSSSCSKGRSFVRSRSPFPAR